MKTKNPNRRLVEFVRGYLLEVLTKEGSQNYVGIEDLEQTLYDQPLDYQAQLLDLPLPNERDEEDVQRFHESVSEAAWNLIVAAIREVLKG